MTNVTKPILILNLAENLSKDLETYFAERKITVIGQESFRSDFELTHILTQNEHDFSFIKNQYQTLSKNIKIISLSPVEELEDFVGANGKLILQDVWLKNGFGRFILDKFFQDYGGISLTDSFPVFKEKGSFNIANPFNTGEYLDRMVYSAFESGVSALSMKTFFDHIVMYLAGLKTKGKVGLPLEVTYGNFEDIFGIQIHFFSQDLILEDLTLSLSKHVSKKAEEYLLNVSVDSSDFFDFTFLQEVNKAVITALWSKDERIKVENRGLLISELSTNAPIAQYPSEGLSSFQVQKTQIEDLSERVVLPAKSQNTDSFSTRLKPSTSEDEVNQMIPGGSQGLSVEVNQMIPGGSQGLTEEVNQKIPGRSKGLTEEVTLVKGAADAEDEWAQILSGTTDFKTDEFQRINGLNDSSSNDINLIKGNKNLNQMDQKQLIKGSKESSIESRTMIKGGKDTLNQNMMAKTFAADPKVKELLQIKSFTDPMPKELKQSFHEHLALSNKSPEEATQEDFEEYKSLEIQKAQEQTIFNQDKHVVTGESSDIFSESDESMLVKSMPGKEKPLATKSNMLQSQGDNKFAPGQDKMLMTSQLRSDLNQSPMDATQAPGRDQKMMALAAENESLKSKMKTLLTEVKILKDSRAQMAEIHKKALEATVIATHGESDNKADQILKEQMLQKLKDQKVFGDQDSRKYIDLMEREKNSLKESKELENKFKKLQIESSQKETFFSQEIEKIQRQLKAKDLVVLKTKESLMKIVEKKDEDLLAMQEKVNQAVRNLEKINPQAQVAYIKDLERKISSSDKMIEIYKEKLAQKPAAKTDDELAKEENKKLLILNNQIKNQFEGAKREIQKLQERVSSDSALVMNLKAEKLKLEQAAKKASLEVRKEELTNNNQPALENEIKKLKNLCDFYEGQIKEAQARQRDSEAKYQASLKLQKKEVIAEDAGKGKVGQLENNVRKLTQDLMESRNQVTEMKKEATKLKQDKIALQNQLDNLKKSTDKSKGAAPKKPGTGGKAA